MEEERILIRLWITGKRGVGKSSIMKRYVNNTFDRINSSIIMDFMLKDIFINEKKIRLYIYDDSEKRYKLDITSFNYCSIEAFIVVFDVSNKQSFLEAIELLYEHKAELIKHKNKKNYEHNTKYSCYSKLFVLLANKCDCENRIITTEEAKKQAEELEVIYAETSAKTGYGIDEIFKEIITKRIEYYEIMRKEKILKEKISIIKKSKPSLCAIL